MAPSRPHQLEDGDAVFLSMETQSSGGHVGALMILDPTGRPDFRFETLRDHVAERVALVPRFGWKLQPVPLELDRPYWVEANDFEPQDQIFRTAVPRPGTLRQVTELAARLHAQPLDRSRPLWEVWCIEGLEGDRVAVYMKTHHCLVDGTGGAGLGEILADLQPDPVAPPTVPEAFREDRPAPPTGLDVATRALRNAARRPERLLRHAARGVADLVRSRNEQDAVGSLERHCFNGPVGRRRAVAVSSIELERVRDLKKHFDVKLNDVVLELVGSAVRRWLHGQGERPERPLVAMCPVSTRGDEQGLGNQITSMSVSLATDQPDPVRRLKAIHESSTRAKAGLDHGSFDWVAAMAESVAPAAAQLAMKLADLSADLAPLPGQFVVSNVRSTPVPLHLAGARVESMLPLSMLATGQGMNITLISYCDRIDIGIIVDPDQVPDPWELADHFPRALEELEAAAEGVVHQRG